MISTDELFFCPQNGFGLTKRQKQNQPEQVL